MTAEYSRTRPACIGKETTPESHPSTSLSVSNQHFHTSGTAPNTVEKKKPTGVVEQRDTDAVSRPKYNYHTTDNTENSDKKTVSMKGRETGVIRTVDKGGGYATIAEHPPPATPSFSLPPREGCEPYVEMNPANTGNRDKTRSFLKRIQLWGKTLRTKHKDHAPRNPGN